MNTYDPTTPVKVKHQRLLALANFLDDLPSDKFHMPTWVSNNATEHSCGTAGCACGWAATIFQKEGFILQPYLIPFVSRGGQTIMRPSLKGAILFGLSDPCVDFAEFFGLNFEYAHAITSAFYYDSTLMPSYHTIYGTKRDGTDITPRHAADRIRKVLEVVDPDVLKEEEQCKLLSLELKKNLVPS